MLISCISCKSKYLINSADLLPTGRTVQCANCGNKWYQEKNSKNKEPEIPLKKKFQKFEKLDHSVQNNKVNNLPSTYVKEQKVSILNSILVIIFVIFLIFIFWLSKNIEFNTLILLKFYIDEFYFNLKLIFNDIAKVIYQIINL